MATAPGLSKVFIIDKYFTELQKYWETEKKMKGRKVKEMGRFTNPTTGDEKPSESSSSEVYDLIHLQGPLTEDSIVRALDARFHIHECLTNIGLLVLAMNGYERKGNPVTLASCHHDAPKYPQLLRIAQDAVRQQSETGYPQAIILSGESGSGKTYCCMLLLRHLFDAAGGGPETDSFKHLSAAFTVLKSLGSAKTVTNAESSRIGQFIEVQITDGALYRTKIHCYYLDQTRVLKQYPNEKNYHIFYQMLAGLTKDERAKLNLEGYNVNNLRYLNRGDTSQNEVEDAVRFEAWKTALSVLGIPFMDVVRVLSAILLLGNIKFNDGQRHNPVLLDSSNIGFLDSKASNEIKAVASLLGISSVALYRGLTTRTQNVRGQLIKSVCDGLTASKTRDGLAKALYCRTVATIVRRANSLKRIGSTCGTMSSDSNESIQNQIETGSHHASTVGSSGAKSHKSLNVLNSAVRHATDGFIGILDMFGFEDAHPSHLEHLCINLCAETMQHYYNTIIFKTSMESCQEEGVSTDFQVDYVDNVPCIDFISSLRTGLLEMLDVETFLKGTPESYVAKIKAQHYGCSRYFHVDRDFESLGNKLKNGNVIDKIAKENLENNSLSNNNNETHNHHQNHHQSNNNLKNNNKNITNNNNNNNNNYNNLNNNNDEKLSRFFGVRHFAGNVVYDTNDFIEANRDTIPDDIVSVFHKSSCTFGFASHLFGIELKALFARDQAPCGLKFRISPTSHNNLQHGNDITTTLTQDFHTRLDNLLRTIVHAKPHFIRCIKSNNKEQPSHFDRPVVMKQIRSLQVLETLNLMACGLPHRMRFRAFTMRYRCIGPLRRIKKVDDKSSAEDCKVLLDSFTSALEQFDSITPSTNSWAIGKRHVFLSEGARQQLELLRNAKRNYAAVIIQAAWRGWSQRKRWPIMVNNNSLIKMVNGGMSNGKRYLGKSGSTHSTINHHGLSTIKPSGLLSTSLSGLNRPRPQPITGTPPPEPCDAKIIAHTCSLFGLDLQRPPPVPPSRPYTVAGNTKLGYPQTRTMKLDYPEVPTGSEPQLLKGEVVVVIGASAKRGYLIVEHSGHTFHVPYQYMEFKSYPSIAAVTSPPASL